MEKLLILGLVGLFTWNAFAGFDDFNSIIQENQKVQADLHNRLQKDAGIELDSSTGSIAKENRYVPTESEQIVVSTSSKLLKPRARNVEFDEKPQMNRLSQKMKEMTN